MAINLQDFRTAFQDYLKTKVTCTISPIRPDAPTTVNPGEYFSFDVTVSNAAVASGGIRLKNIRYKIMPPLQLPTLSYLACFVTPAASVGKTYPLSGGLTPNDPNKELTPGYGYILYPPEGDFKTLDPGESDTITNLRGKALNKVGVTSIRFQDMEYLFPLNEKSSEASKSFQIT
jgi:hypothetical protein